MRNSELLISEFSIYNPSQIYLLMGCSQTVSSSLWKCMRSYSDTKLFNHKLNLKVWFLRLYFLLFSTLPTYLTGPTTLKRFSTTYFHHACLVHVVESNC